MKRTYITPAIKVTNIEIESALLQESGTLQDFSKGHNSFWDSSFWGEEETEKPMFQQPKSLWDD